MDPKSIEPVWACPTDGLISLLGSSAMGLTSDEAAMRARQYGANSINERSPRRLFRDFFGRLRNPLVLVLLAAAAIAGFTGDTISFAIITSVVVLSVLLDFFQEQRAQTAADKLREQVALTTHVFRDRTLQTEKANSLVPGDVLSLCAGDLIPADCRLLTSRDLFVDQSLLTGESYPAEKISGAQISEAEGPVPHDAVFMGSSVVSGTATAIVAYTGRMTMLGGIAGQLQKEPPPTAFALGLRDFSTLIMRLTVLLVLFVLLANVLFHRPALESFLFALALAVGLTPELLPMIVSVTLAHGALRMADKHVIVKRLSAIHDLGSMDILCSDKTGTLTEGTITLIKTVDLEGVECPAIQKAAYLNAAFETGIKSPLDDAILKIGKTDISGWSKIDEVPFDFERRRVSVLVEGPDARRLIVKGAPEDILKLSSAYLHQDAVLPMGDDTKQRALTALADYGKQGFRALGIAWRDVASDFSHAGLKDETLLTFGGFALFLDPPKASAVNALKEIAALGVDVKIVTGDNEHVTNHVCAAIGISDGETLTGEQIHLLSDEALVAKLRTTNKFCRVSPPQKLRVISALRRSGHVVGYLGDGINDAPSLHTADVGLSVNGAVDVAKEAASMILLENDLSVLADGIREGRRTFANIMKYVLMGTSSNFGNMFSMAGGVLFLPFLPMLPVQILLNNLLYDISEIAIPMDNVDPDMVAKPRRWDIKFVRDFMLVLGPLSSLFDFVTFAILLWYFHASEKVFHSGWFVESLATQCLVILVIRTRGSPLQSRPNKWLVIASLAVVGLALLLPYTFVGHWFGLVAMPVGILGALTATTLSYLVLVEFVKRWFYRHHDALITART